MVEPITPEQKLQQVRESARARGYECTLTLNNVKRLMRATHCAYTGEPFGDSQSARMSFERVDNTIGYIPCNVVPVSIHVNQLKGDLTLNAIRHKAKTFPGRRQDQVEIIKSRIKGKHDKIAARERHIRELEAHNRQDKVTITELLVEQKVAEKLVADDIRDGKFYEQIATTIEKNPTLGMEYLTIYQGLKVKVKKILESLGIVNP